MIFSFMVNLDMNTTDLTQNATTLVRLAIERDGVIRNALARGIVNTRALARDIEITANGKVSFDAILSAIRRYPVNEAYEKRKSFGNRIIKLSLRNGITVVSLKNSNDLQKAILRFSSDMNFAAGETFRLVTNMDNASVTIDSKNLARFESFISSSQVNRKLEGLAEVLVEMPIEIETAPGLLSTIVTELAINDVAIRQFNTIGPGRMIILVDESDATRAFDALEKLSKL